jgi:hypothetical protein
MLLKIPGFGKILGITGRVLRDGVGRIGAGDGRARRGGMVEWLLTGYVIKQRTMDKTVRGGIVSILGMISLVAAFVAINTGDVARHLGVVCTGGILGALAFFTGIRMMPDKSGVNH